MKIIYTDDFKKSLQKLPKEINRIFQTQETRFKDNWNDSRLHIKKIRILKYALSFRITRRYRAFFYFQDPETAIFFDIDHRKDSYRRY
jgi:mRNA-degrading endonuclease RelE of RelBE toxin-antitoxin system